MLSPPPSPPTIEEARNDPEAWNRSFAALEDWKRDLRFWTNFWLCAVVAIGLASCCGAYLLLGMLHLPN